MEFTVSSLTYLRISSTVRMRHGKTADLVCMGLLGGVLVLECIKFIDMAIILDYSEVLLYLSLVYRTVLDVLMCGYSVHIVWEASQGSQAANGAMMREDRALLFAYIFRIVLFIGIDIVWLAAIMTLSSYWDMSLGALTLWIIDRVCMPWKPYLVITDAGRIRTLAEGRSIDGLGTSGTLKNPTPIVSKTDGSVNPLKLATSVRASAVVDESEA
ncbi:hypothetical protein HKX48_000307 [Thoreauomyces humboldtii]|nr:hypothetical protein HKX48_000307 [Thoreauomyces humboldtii]